MADGRKKNDDLSFIVFQLSDALESKTKENLSLAEANEALRLELKQAESRASEAESALAKAHRANTELSSALQDQRRAQQQRTPQQNAPQQRGPQRAQQRPQQHLSAQQTQRIDAVSHPQASRNRAASRPQAAPASASRTEFSMPNTPRGNRRDLLSVPGSTLGKVAMVVVAALVALLVVSAAWIVVFALKNGVGIAESFGTYAGLVQGLLGGLFGDIIKPL